MPIAQRVFLIGLFVALAAFATSGVTQAQPVAKKRQVAPKPTVAVLYFDYSGNDEDMAFLRKGLTQMLVTDLSASKDMRLVERTDLEAVLKELELNKTKKINRASANKIGKLLGARYLVTGGYFAFKGKLRVDAKIIDVELGTTKGVGVLKEVDDFLALEKELAGKLEEKLVRVHRAKPSASKTSRRGTRTAKAGTKKAPPTRRVAARTVARYGRALDAIDKGNKKVAMKELSDITSETPDFKPAAAELKVLLR